MFTLLCVAASIPSLPKVRHKSAAVTQGMGAAKLISKVVLPTRMTNSFAWKYPPGVDSAALWWNIEQADSAKGPWTVLVTNASGACEVTVNRSEPLHLYRLALKLEP